MFHLKYNVMTKHLFIPTDHDLSHFSITTKMEIFTTTVGHGSLGFKILIAFCRYIHMPDTGVSERVVLQGSP